MTKTPTTQTSRNCTSNGQKLHNKSIAGKCQKEATTILHLKEALEHFTAAHTPAVVVYEPKPSFLPIAMQIRLWAAYLWLKSSRCYLVVVRSTLHLGRVCFNTSPHVLLKLSFQLYMTSFESGKVVVHLKSWQFSIVDKPCIRSTLHLKVEECCGLFGIDVVPNNSMF